MKQKTLSTERQEEMDMHWLTLVIGCDKRTLINYLEDQRNKHAAQLLIHKTYSTTIPAITIIVVD